MSQLRNFEISIWTLQDDFITVIESAWIKNKGKTENASMTLNIDGTQQLTFRVPMYYYVDGKRVANPAWLTFTESKVLLNTRKVKVILNKQTDNEEIYEFVIDKVTEEHDRDEFYCDVDCSGLAFYELGKIGYKVALSEEEFYNDDYNWFIGKTDSNGNKLFTEQPVANIQYWLNKFLTPYPSSGDSISAATWYYKIQMNWDLTADFAEFTKDSDKIYENDIYGDTYLLSQEKYRMINLEESNFYNLTQNIAETFGVYCKYVYNHDENYHIVGRTIVFYNNFLDEENLAINYRGNTQSISRELDTTDLVTKMFVRTVDNNGDTTSIIDVEENDLGEDYLLNFDYLYSIGSIDEDAYSAIEPYKTNLKEINVQLKAVSERIINIENKLPEVRARASLAEDSIQLDNEKITANNKLLNSLTGGTGILEITNKNPDTAVLLKEQNADYYYIKLTKTGIDASTVKIYKTLSVTSANNTLTSEIKTAIPVYDDSNNLIRMTNIYWNDDTRSKIVYLTYKYQPSLYYENIIKTWIQKLNKDTQEAEDANNELEALENDLDTATKLQRDLLARKAALNSEFEKLMGPAIREGYWQPEDYSEYVETFIASYKLNNLKIVGGTHYDTFLWDTQLFEGEQDISYKLGIEQAITYYPCINLTNIWDIVKNNLNSLSFVFYDTANTEQYNSVTLRQLSFGSGAQVIFLVKDDNVFPALLLTGLESYNNESIAYARENGKIGFVSYDTNGNYHISGGTSGQGTTIKNFWLTLDNTYQAVYPRIRIESMSLKTDTNSLIVRDNGTTILNQYTDYYITTRVDASEHIVDNPIVGSYYITIKPTIVAKTQGLSNHILEIMFKIADCAIAIYRDAKEILKENSKPKVSYSSTIDILNNNIIYRPSHFLSKIVKINDYDLLLDEAWGYVSGVTLDLDHPEHDNIEIQNYTNKFEDLFTTIVAQTEAMKKTSYIVDTISNSFTPDGSLSANILQNSLSKVDLNYAFNNGNLTIDEANGIWGTSDSGVVAFRGGGIFTATERDRRNNWIWNTGITPEGINADRITSGQLDTNKIRVFAGDRERFQLNGTGLYGYKSFMSDFDVFYNAGSIDYPSEMRDKIQNDDQVLDPAQFVRFDENGLFLVAKEGAYVLNEDRTEYVIITPQWTDLDGVTHRRLDDDNELKRVAISWDGLTLRNLKGERVFYADSNTGDLKLKGSVFASNFYVIKDDGTTDTFTNYIRINGAEESLLQLRNDLDNNGDIRDRIESYIDTAENAITEHYDAVTGALQEAIDSANGEIESAKGRISTAEDKISEAEQAIADLDKDLDDSIQSLTDTLTGQQQALTDLTNNYNQFSEDIRDAIVPEVFNGENLPLDQNYKVGDIFYNTITGDEYICTSVSNPKVAGDWTKTSTPIIHGTKLDVNADAGTIEMLAAGSITLAANSTINMGAGEKINLASNGSINIVTSNQNQEVSTILLKPGDITIASSSTVTMASGAKMNINSGEVKVIGGTIDVSSAGKFNLTGASELNLTGSKVNLTGVSEMNLAGSKLNLTGTSELKLTSSKMDLVSSSELNLSGSKLKLAGTSNLDLVGGSILNIGTTEEASSLNIASKGKFSAISGDFWIAATDYNTFNSKSDADKKALSYMHGYLGPLDNKYHLDIGSDNLRIMAGGSLNMESGGTIDIKAGGTIELLSGTDSGIKLSDNGIDILSNAYINIAAGALKISSTGSTTSKSIDTYVSDEIASKTNNLITNVDVEYCRSTKSKNLTDDSITVPWSTNAPEWRNGEYIWQRTATYTSGSTQPSYSDATCISGADGKSGTGITSTTIEYGTSSSASTSPASWSEIVPTNIAKGTWLWVKTTILYSDTTGEKISYTKSYVGDDGKDGKSVVIQSVVKEEGKTTVVLNDGTTTKTLEIEDGTDGKNGAPGAPGTNSYVHIAWANSADGTVDFSTSESNNKKYIGVRTDNTQTDPEEPPAYSWSLIKGEDGAGIQSTAITYGTSDSAITTPTSWSNDVPTSIAKKTWLWVKTVTTYTGGLDEKTTYTKSYIGDDGQNGYNQVTLYLYKRAQTNPGGLSSGTFTYNFSDGILSGIPTGWSREIKEGTDPCWFISASVISRNTSINFDYTQWTNTATKLVENGIGVDGLNTATIYLYKRSESTPTTKPSNVTYKFSDASCSGALNNWTTEIESGTTPCWIIAAKAISRTDTYIFSSPDDWAGPIKLVENGTNGTNGLNQATIYLYQRASEEPKTPTTSATYTFANGNLTNIPSGWSRDIPSGVISCWVVSGIAISKDGTDEISEWTKPAKLVESGINTATIYLYRRSSTQPTTSNGMMPTKEIIYNFGEKTITNSESELNGWKKVIPTDDGNPCWIISAVAASESNTDTIGVSEWGTSATKFVESGQKGENGINRATVYLYQWAEITPGVPSGTLIYNFNNGSIGEKDFNAKNGWEPYIPEKPSDNRPCYITSAAAIGSADMTSCEIDKTAWATPIEFIKYGTDGTSVNIKGSYDTVEELNMHQGFEGDAYIVDGELYVWTLNKWTSVGQIQGPPGKSENVFIRYAENIDNLDDADIYSSPTKDTLYIGFCLSYDTYGPSDANRYEWSKYIGTDGYNKATLTAYKRSKKEPNSDDRPAPFSYFFDEGLTDDSLSGEWTSSIPSDDGNPCWAIMTTVVSQKDSLRIEPKNWSEIPIKLVQSGFNSKTIVLYKRKETKPSLGEMPDKFTYNFKDGIPKNASYLNGWSESIPTDNGEPCWVISATALSQGEEDEIERDEWTSSLVKFVESGKSGISQITLYLYKWYTDSETHPTPSEILRYNFEQNKIFNDGDLEGWSEEILPDPEDGRSCYITSTVMVAQAGTTYYDINPNKWSEPIKITGKSGEPGFNRATITLYKRVKEIADIDSNKPKDLKYIFSDGSFADMNGNTSEAIELDVLNGWSKTMPSIFDNNVPCWIISVTAISRDEDDDIPRTEWTWPPVKLVEDGLGIKEIKEQYLLYSNTANPSIPNVPPANNWEDEQPIWRENYSIWTCSKITWDDDSITYTDPVKAEGINNINERLVQAEFKVEPDRIIATVGEKFVEKDTMIIEDTLYYLATDKSTGVTLEDTGWQTTLPTFTNEKPILWIYHNYTCENGYNEKTSPEYIYENNFEAVNKNTIIKITPKSIALRSSSNNYPIYSLADNAYMQNLNYETAGFLDIQYSCTCADNTIIYYDMYKDLGANENIIIKKIYSYYLVNDGLGYSISNVKEETPLVLSKNSSVCLEATVSYSYKNDNTLYTMNIKSPTLSYTSGGVLTNFSSIYWLDNTSSYPSVPTNYITSNSINVRTWTQKYNPYRDGYNYIYKTDQYKLSDGTYHVGTVDIFNPMIDINSRLQKTELAITDGTIRMQARELVWKADNSEMSADGTLRIKRAIIDGVWSGVYNYKYGGEDVRDGLLLGRAQIIGLKDGKNLFNILMPYADMTAPMTIESYVDSNGDVVSGNVEPEQPEVKSYSLANHTVALPSSLGSSIDKTLIMTNKDSLCGIDIGTNSKIMLRLSNDGDSILLDASNLYISDGMHTFKGLTSEEYLTSGNGKRLHFVNGILVGYD